MPETPTGSTPEPAPADQPADQTADQHADQPGEPASAGSAGSAGAAPGGVRAQLSDVLRRLEQAGAADGPDAAPTGGLAAAADAHTEALRATLEAKREAEELLARATKVHGDATEQAERILSEAKEVAQGLHAEARAESARLREEMGRWAAERRSSLEADVSALLDAARKEAAEMRADALSKAMPEAEETARRYVAMARAAGEQDAEALREEARGVLAHAAEALTRAQEHARELRELLTTHATSIDEQVDTLASLADAARARSIGTDDAVGGTAGSASGSERPDTGTSVAVVTETTSMSAVTEGERGALPRQRTSSEGGPLGSMFGQPNPEDS